MAMVVSCQSGPMHSCSSGAARRRSSVQLGRALFGAPGFSAPRCLNKASSPRVSRVPKASAGGGAGSIGGGRNDGWGGGGGGGGDSGSGSGDGAADGDKGKGGFVWKGWAERVAYDPEFPFKVFLEQVIGVGASVVGDMSSRPNWGMNELDFVGSILNFSLMYLLAPTASVAGSAASTGLITRILTGDFLVKWGAPAGNMFEAGFPLGKRLVNVGYKGVVFAGIGFLAGIVGTTTSNALIALRQQLDPTFVPQNEAPSVLGNASCWAVQMGVSSNLRYQILGGTDVMLLKVMPVPVFRAYSAVVRAINNIIGGISFVTVARLFGVQKSAPKEATA